MMEITIVTSVLLASVLFVFAVLMRKQSKKLSASAVLLGVAAEKLRMSALLLEMFANSKTRPLGGRDPKDPTPRQKQSPTKRDGED